MPDGRRRSREGWADTMEAGPAHPPAHVHRLPKAVRLALVGLCGAVFLLLVALGLTAVYVYQASQYVQGRGEFRDAEAARMEAQSEEQIRQAMCDLLDQLPEGGLLERPRSKYGCGPGIPLSELPPEQQERLRSQRTAPVPSSQPVAPAPSSAPTPLVEGANPSGPVLTPEAPSTPPPSTASEPPPLVDLGPYTGPVCESVRVCF